MKFVLTLYSLLFITCFASASTLDSLRSEQRAEGLVIIHQVEEQETLYSIARRYRGSVSEIIERNEIQDNTIDIGQVIEILVENSQNVIEEKDADTVTNSHIVKQGETLYSISRAYNIKVNELKELNELSDNAISPGMILRLGKGVNMADETSRKIDTVTSTPDPKLTAIVEEVDPFEDFEKYLVQTGETLYTIATKIGVKSDSLRKWNELNSNYLKIGQQLYYMPASDTI
ncbi:MAG: LysM peptidoglycan-binding domain-containing protein, partial [Ekhidna sp.]